ncbi:hypothetical protein ACOME3_001562 [Neoechinorhynchus agilis]
MKSGFTLLFVFLYSVKCMNNGLALTPVMGWLSWQRYGCHTDCERDPDNCLNDALIRRQARGLVRTGLADAGYKYIIIDDCWSEKTRDDETGELKADHKRFPNGIKDLSSYVHSLGLKFGIYGDYGNFTCAGYPGSLMNVHLDMKTFAKWGVDYVKMDGCFADPESFDVGYPKDQGLICSNVSVELNATGRPIIFACSWPIYQLDHGKKINYKQISKYCNQWRNFYDISSNWESVKRIKKYYTTHYDELNRFHGPGSWNDPDMLLVGLGKLTHSQELHQMAIWSMWSAPLIMSNDILNYELTLESLQVLTNLPLIRVNQDSFGSMGKAVHIDDDYEIWTKQLASKNNHTKIAVLFARVSGQVPKQICAKLSDLGLHERYMWEIEDMFKPKEPYIRPYTFCYCAMVDPFGVAGFVADSDVNGKEDLIHH